MKKLLLSLLSLTLLFSSSTFVLAIEDGDMSQKEENQLLRDERLAQRKSILEELRKDRCERLSERIETRVEGYEKNKEKHVMRYTNLQKRLDILVDKLGELGLDTSKLEEDQVTLTTLVDDFLAKYAMFSDEMKGVKSIACDEVGDKDMFRKDVESARAYLKDARDAAKAIHDFVKNTLKPDLLDLKEQAAQLNLNEEEEDEE